MPKITKPDMSNIWAEGGSVAVVPSEKISQGWVVEIPPCEQMNFVQNRQDAGIAYVLQQGIPEWDSSTEYQTGTSYVQSDSIIYKAIATGTNKPPVSFPAFWEVAFDNAGSAQIVQDQLDAIEADADPFGQYLLEDVANNYGIDADLADNLLTSTNLNVISDGMYEFDATCTNKPFDSGKLTQHTSGSVKYQSAESLDQSIATRSATSGAYTDWKYVVATDTPINASALQDQITDLQNSLAAISEATKIKIGDLFLTINNFLAPSEVTTHLGYGTWIRAGEGRALVGISTTPSDPAWTKTMYNGEGSYTRALTVDNLAAHNHSLVISTDNNSVSPVNGNHGLSTNPTDMQYSAQPMLDTGLGEPFGIVQPSVVIGIWRRTL